MLCLLAESSVAMSSPQYAWAPVVMLILMAIAFVVGTAIASSLVGPSRTGRVKELTYESGMNPIGDTRQRFNVRFYLVAIMYVAFAVEIVVLYPWAASFSHALYADPDTGTRMFVGAGIFFVLLLVGYLYDIGKGVLKWQ
jgi:NADH-quinone oxidoreductase subunit A